LCVYVCTVYVYLWMSVCVCEMERLLVDQ